MKFQIHTTGPTTGTPVAVERKKEIIEEQFVLVSINIYILISCQ
jgi:hypothetical protein